MAGLSKPTIHLFPIFMTGTPICPVFFWMVRAAEASRSMFISLKGMRFSLK